MATARGAAQRCAACEQTTLRGAGSRVREASQPVQRATRRSEGYRIMEDWSESSFARSSRVTLVRNSRRRGRRAPLPLGPSGLGGDGVLSGCAWRRSSSLGRIGPLAGGDGGALLLACCWSSVASVTQWSSPPKGNRASAACDHHGEYRFSALVSLCQVPREGRVPRDHRRARWERQDHNRLPLEARQAPGLPDHPCAPRLTAPDATLPPQLHPEPPRVTGVRSDDRLQLRVRRVPQDDLLALGPRRIS